MAYKSNILLKLTNFVDGVITFAKLQNIATAKLLGRTSASSGVIEELDIANYTNQLIPLTTTFADCENTTDEIDIVTVTIPANTLAVGDIVELHYYIQMKQNQGGSVSLTQRTKNGSNVVYTSSNSITDSGNERQTMHKVKYIITNLSSGTATFRTNTNTLTTTVTESISPAIGATLTGVGSGTIANNTFDNTVGTDFIISAQWATANANTYIRVQTVQAYIIKKAV